MARCTRAPLDLDAAPLDALVLGQPLQQFAVAAAQVQHLGVGLDQLADDGVVAAPQHLPHERPRRGSAGRGIVSTSP